LLISFILVLFGFYLTFKKNNSETGSIAFGTLKVRKSTAGIVFMIFGAITLIFSINKGVGMKRKSIVTEKRSEYDSLGRKTVEIETKEETVDSAAATPPQNTDD
ncbi:hypothetical protein, partial [Flavobacterium sp.]